MSTGRPYAGITVLDLTQELGGYASRLFADLGAQVIRFEALQHAPVDGDVPASAETPAVVRIDQSFPREECASVALKVTHEAGGLFEFTSGYRSPANPYFSPPLGPTSYPSDNHYSKGGTDFVLHVLKSDGTPDIQKTHEIAKEVSSQCPDWVVLLERRLGTKEAPNQLDSLYFNGSAQYIDKPKVQKGTGIPVQTATSLHIHVHKFDELLSHYQLTR